MATIPVPAVIVSTSDPRLFPSEEERERERAEAREKALPPSRPVLYTTVSDDPPENKGCLGTCDFASCECLYFAGKGGVCGRCSHANLYHRVKIRRVDLEAKMAAGANTGGTASRSDAAASRRCGADRRGYSGRGGAAL